MGGALCLAAIVPQTHAAVLTDTRAVKGRKEAETGERRGGTAGHYSAGGGGEKTRRASHLWCVSLILRGEGG